MRNRIVIVILLFMIIGCGTDKRIEKLKRQYFKGRASKKIGNLLERQPGFSKRSWTLTEGDVGEYQIIYSAEVATKNYPVLDFLWQPINFEAEFNMTGSQKDYRHLKLYMLLHPSGNVDERIYSLLDLGGKVRLDEETVLDNFYHEDFSGFAKNWHKIVQERLFAAFGEALFSLNAADTKMFLKYELLMRSILPEDFRNYWKFNNKTDLYPLDALFMRTDKTPPETQALKQVRYELLKLLLDAGFDKTSLSNSFSALSLFPQDKSPEVAELLSQKLGLKNSGDPSMRQVRYEGVTLNSTPGAYNNQILATLQKGETVFFISYNGILQDEAILSGKTYQGRWVKVKTSAGVGYVLENFIH